MHNTQALLQKIEALPPERIAEVEDFVEFLGAKAARLAALDRLLAIAPAVEAAGIPAMSMDEIDAEVKAVRAERRARDATRTLSSADRS
jgi:hypothetical protein